MGLVEFEEKFLHLFPVHSVRDKLKTHAVHFRPVFFKLAEIVYIFIEGRAWKRGEFGDVEFVNRQ